MWFLLKTLFAWMMMMTPTTVGAWSLWGSYDTCPRGVSGWKSMDKFQKEYSQTGGKMTIQHPDEEGPCEQTYSWGCHAVYMSPVNDTIGMVRGCWEENPENMDIYFVPSDSPVCRIRTYYDKEKAKNTRMLICAHKAGLSESLARVDLGVVEEFLDTLKWDAEGKTNTKKKEDKNFMFLMFALAIFGLILLLDHPHPRVQAPQGPWPPDDNNN